MREFKFIRGIYKDERIFNTDETNDTLFALYGDGSHISLDIKNDEDFQKKIAGLPSEEREIYTIRPSQFNVKATRQPNDDYAFEYNLDGKFAYDGSKEFPDIVKNAAAIRLSTYTNVEMFDPSLILKDAEPKITSVNFTYDNKSFTKNLYFRVYGDVAEFSITTANDKDITAYKMIDGNFSYKDSITGTFHNGKKQKEAESTDKSIATDQITVDSKGTLNVASQYIAGTDYKFLINETQLSDNVKYEDNLTFDLYKKVMMYLTQSNADSALDEDGRINQGFVVYHKDNCPSTTYCYKEEVSSLVNVTAYLEDKCEKGPITNANRRYYSYYELHGEPAYILEGSCNVLPRDGIIVKDYSQSYDNLLIICTDESTNKQKLRPIKNEDLTPGASVKVYLGDIDSYNVFNNGVYINDPDDNADYVMLSSKGNASIANSNAYINNEGDVVPKQDLSTFRQIVKGTLKINATES